MMTWKDRYKRMKRAYKITDADVAAITGHTPASVSASVSQTTNEFPRWLRLAIVLYERNNGLEQVDDIDETLTRKG